MKFVWYLITFSSICLILINEPKSDLPKIIRQNNLSYSTMNNTTSKLEMVIWLLISIFLFLTTMFAAYFF